jgi:hypothetical protein
VRERLCNKCWVQQEPLICFLTTHSSLSSSRRRTCLLIPLVSLSKETSKVLSPSSFTSLFFLCIIKYLFSWNSGNCVHYKFSPQPSVITNNCKTKLKSPWNSCVSRSRMNQKDTLIQSFLTTKEFLEICYKRKKNTPSHHLTSIAFKPNFKHTWERLSVHGCWRWVQQTRLV